MAHIDYPREVFSNNTVVDAAEVLNKFDLHLYELFNNVLVGEYVWKNEAPSNTFDAQIVMIDCLRVPQYYEIEYSASDSASDVRFTTGQIPIEYSTQLQVLDGSTMRYREATVEIDGGFVNFTFSTGKYSSSSTSAKYVIPQRIKFYY